MIGCEGSVCRLLLYVGTKLRTLNIQGKAFNEIWGIVDMIKNLSHVSLTLSHNDN